MGRWWVGGLWGVATNHMDAGEVGSIPALPDRNVYNHRHLVDEMWCDSRQRPAMFSAPFSRTDGCLFK